jgi:4-amino-4-deoxy-L-arabinose transferase-like glycosyltransferase
VKPLGRWSSRSASVRAALLACAVSAALYGAVAASLPFYDKGEPREALVVQAILRGDGVILPRPDGRHLPSKPPLFHWLAALASASAGSVGELTMRLPSVVVGALGVALTVLVAGRAYGATAGSVSGVVLASSFEWFRAATQSRVDMTLTFFVVVATLAWYRGLTRPDERGMVRAGYLAATAAVLTKGPVGVVLPALVLVAEALRRREPRSLLPLVDAPGALGLLVLCMAWYGLAWTRGGAEFARRHLVEENVQRFVGWGTVGHRHPALYYVPALAGAFLPWTLALPVAARRLWERRERWDGFLLAWIVTVLCFYSLAAGKRSTYLLPIFPPLAILVGAALAVSTERPPAVRVRTAIRVSSIAVLVAAATFALDLAAPLVQLLGGFIHGSDRARLPAALTAVREHRWALATTLGTVVVALVAFASPRRGQASRLAAVTAVALAATVGLTAVGTYPLARALTTRPVAERVMAHLRPGDRLCACGDLDWPLRFYLAQSVPPCRALGPSEPDVRTSAIQAVVADTHGGRRRYHLWPLHAHATASRPCGARDPSRVVARSSGAAG